MKSERIELSALARAAGPQLNSAEIETARYLAEFEEACRQADATPREVKMERIQAVRDLLVRPADAEAVRAAYWLRAPLPARMVAVMAARLPKERGNDALMKFDAFERGTIWNALQALVADLSTIQKCMNGGEMPKTKPGRVH
jgi:hypothetical protein